MTVYTYIDLTMLTYARRMVLTVHDEAFFLKIDAYNNLRRK